MDWQTLRNDFMRLIGGDPPGAALEDSLIESYRDHPDAVTRSFEKIGLAWKAGKIHSPWGALKAEVAKAVDAARNPTHSAGRSAEKAMLRAQQRVRLELLHYATETEVIDEVFGARGMLRQHDTPANRATIADLWQNLRPLGELAEHEAIERGRRYAETRHLVA